MKTIGMISYTSFIDIFFCYLTTDLLLLLLMSNYELLGNNGLDKISLENKYLI